MFFLLLKITVQSQCFLSRHKQTPSLVNRLVPKFPQKLLSPSPPKSPFLDFKHTYVKDVSFRWKEAKDDRCKRISTTFVKPRK